LNKDENMVTLASIKPARGSTRRAKRVGRGQGSGQGCTAGYGANGSKARSGNRWKPYFEGGQTPLSRRIPKRGFNRKQRTIYQIVNVGQINAVEPGDKVVDCGWMFARGLIRNTEAPVKILGGGELEKAVTIKAHAFSKTAREKIEKAKGKADVEAGA
jgi:large subunit ribosomal protein L15